MNNIFDEQRLSLIKNKHKQNAVKSLNNYLEQLKIHFDLDDNDIVKILNTSLKNKRKNSFFSKLIDTFR